ncbi:MAG: DUF5347 family protein [Candidatus Phlomobacter fragariae]
MRVNRLIKAAKCRTVHFNDNKENPDNQCLSGFIEYLREKDKLFVNLIFYLARIDNKKHYLKFDEFNKEEKQAIIKSLFQLQVLVALTPKISHYHFKLGIKIKGVNHTGGLFYPK